MDRIVHVSGDHAEAREWDRRQHRQMTPDERRAVAKALRERVHGKDAPDVREYERSRMTA